MVKNHLKKIIRSGSGFRSSPKLKQFFLVTHPTCPPRFVWIRPQLFEICCTQTNNQTNKKKTSFRAWHLQNPHLLSKECHGCIMIIVHFLRIKIDNLDQSSGQTDENWLFSRLKLMIFEVWPLVDLWPLTSTIVSFQTQWCTMQLLLNLQVNQMKIDLVSDEIWWF